MIMHGKQDGRVGTGSQQGWCEDSSVHGKIEYQSTERAVWGVQASDGNRLKATSGVPAGWEQAAALRMGSWVSQSLQCPGREAAGRQKPRRSCCHTGVAIINTLFFPCGWSV